MAKVFALLLSNDARFEIVGNVTLGLVCFRLKVSGCSFRRRTTVRVALHVIQGSNKLSQKLLLSLNDSGHIHMVPSMVNEIYIIRLAVCAKYANDDDMHMAFNIIQEHADIVLAEYSAQRNGRHSSSNDSLELISKQLGTNGEHETIIPENSGIGAEKVSETVDTSTNYSATKARVRRSSLVRLEHRWMYFRRIPSRT